MGRKIHANAYHIKLDDVGMGDFYINEIDLLRLKVNASYYGDSGIYRFELDSDVCLNGISKINQYLNTAKQNKAQTVCIVEDFGAWSRYICHAWVITSHSKLGLYLPLMVVDTCLWHQNP